MSDIQVHFTYKGMYTSTNDGSCTCYNHIFHVQFTTQNYANQYKKYMLGLKNLIVFKSLYHTCIHPVF